jgi:small subunit ribosomal protein S16
MLQIRLLRVGKKHKPSFRLVLVNKGKRPGKYLENLGFYTPTKKENKTENLNNEKIAYWISKGAQLTPTVHNILLDARVITGKKEAIKISKKKGEAKPGEAPKAAAPKAEAPKAPATPAA